MILRRATMLASCLQLSMRKLGVTSVHLLAQNNTRKAYFILQHHSAGSLRRRCVSTGYPSMPELISFWKINNRSRLCTVAIYASVAGDSPHHFNPGKNRMSMYFRCPCICTLPRGRVALQEIIILATIALLAVVGRSDRRAGTP